MSKTLVALILSCAVCACSPSASDQIKSVARNLPGSSEVHTSIVLFSSTRSLLKKVTATHLFSSRTSPDRFQLILLGARVGTGIVHLNILSAKGDTLLHEQFPATSLLDIGLDAYAGDHPTEAQREAYIRKRMDGFFAADRFMSAAVGAADKFDADYIHDKQLWAEMKQDGLPDFIFNLGEESGHRVAYSTRLRKVVTVAGCC